MKAICNPKGENSGHTAEYNGITFQLYMCRDTYYDEQGIPEREVTVKALTSRRIDGMYIDGHLSWIFRRDYNDRRELIHMEDAFYGDGLFDDFQDTPHYTLISELTYEYDEYGNWTICYLRCVDGLQPDELTIREIEYL